MKKLITTYAFLMLVLDIFAQTTFIVNGIAYYPNSTNTVEVIDKTTYYTGSITIPSSVVYSSVTYNVTAIGDGAFWGSTGLTSITIPNSVTSIGMGAFFDSGLTSIIIPNSITFIGDEAFSSCHSLTTINVDVDNANYSSTDGVLFNIDKTTIICYPGGKQAGYVIPSSVTSIGEGAFSGCSGLTSITIPSSVTSIGNEAFNCCTGLTSITIPSSVTSIGDDAFYWCSGLTSITIPSSVTSIGDGAFVYCTGLTSITIPSSVTSIGRGAFSSTAWAWYNNQPDGLIYINNIAYEYKGRVPDNTTITLNAGTTGIANDAFGSCGLTSIIIPSSVTSIGDGAFSDNSGLTSITIPNSVTSIGYEAFSWCTGLTSITIPSSVTFIGSGAFSNCKGLTSITIPSSVSSIGWNAFSGTVWYNNQPDGLIYINNIAYTYKGIMPANTSITLNAGTTGITGYAFSNYILYSNSDCRGLTSITIPSSVTSIGEGAFWGCSGLSSIYAYPINPVDLSSSSNVFLNVNNSTICTLYVPAGSKSKYQVAYAWKNFTNIVEMTPTAVPTINDTNFSLYQNPMDNAIYINGLKGTLRLFDINGRLLLIRQVAGNESVSIGSLPQGLYIVKLITDDGTVERKIMKK